MTELIVKDSQAMQQWELIQRQCRAFLESGFLPRHIQTIAQAITISWKGHELGIPPLQAFSSITVINGKPALSAELISCVYAWRIASPNCTAAENGLPSKPA